jgi:nitrite reductase/ring-hydroxylating ferredoxin subunit
MESTSALSSLANQPALDAVAEPLSRAIRGAYETTGSAGRATKNAMHGVWLGHPLHPVFTDLPLGAWTTAMVLDAVAATNRDDGMERAADVAVAVLVYDQRIGVTHAVVEEPESFRVVARSADLPDNSMTRARTDDADVLLVRNDGRVCALSHPCAHMGGPLSEGTLKAESVVCPWHGSEFGLEDGHVINGPATQNQPCLDVRERAGKIEVKGHVRSPR